MTDNRIKTVRLYKRYLKYNDNGLGCQIGPSPSFQDEAEDIPEHIPR